MKKIDLMKLLKKILVMLIFFLATGTISVFAASQPSNIVIGKKILLDDYFGYGLDFNHKQTTSGQVIYCMDYPLEPPYEGMNLAYSSESDAGITYIMQNGYPNKKITGDNRKDYFITQLAVWIYLNNSSTEINRIKSEMNTNSNIMYVSLKNLVNGANNAKKTGYITPAMKLNINSNNLTLSSDGKYYVSEQIGINTRSVTGNYKVTLTNAPKGTLVQTVSGKNSNEFSINTKFIVKVPVSSISNLQSNFLVNVTTIGAVNKTYIYKSSNSDYQRMIVSTLYPVTKTLVDKTTLVIKTDKVIINKTDSETGKNIAGATLAINDVNGKEVMRWVTTTNSKVIMNLPVGKYTLYEVKAPNGYEKSDKVYNFEISNNGKENKIDVPNVELVHTAQVEISKQDVTTSKELPGAKLTIKDNKGKVIETWISTDKPHYLTLEVGKYTLIEEIAPEGYILSKEEIEFEITKNTKDIVKKVMYNTPEPKPEPEQPKEEPKEEIVVEVPKTDVNSSVFYGLSASISALGYGLMKKFGRK